MSHGADREPLADIDALTAQRVAETLQALAAPSRVRILVHLAEHGPIGVSELAEEVGMEASAVSHQLRLLRHLGLVSNHREGRRVSYDLFDDHVARFLAEAVSHVEHLRQAGAEADAAATGAHHRTPAHRASSRRPE